VYAAAGALRAVRFDLGRLEVTSDPVPVLEKVTMASATGAADFAVAQNGTLVYVAGSTGMPSAYTLAWVDRRGREEPTRAPPRAYAIPRIAPDGTRVALDIHDQDNDIWVWDLKRETLTRLTLDPTADTNPVWTPDSRRLIFASARGGGWSNLFEQAADNTGAIERLTTSPNGQVPTSIVPDGTRVLFSEVSPKTNSDVHVLTLAAPRSTQPLIQTAFEERSAEISPDGRWLAYQSNESGTDQIYVRPFPNVDDGRWQISMAGGFAPAWARSGRELFYATPAALMSVTVRSTGTTFAAENPTKVFDTAAYLIGQSRTYDVAPDGQRFLMIKPSQTGQDRAASAPCLTVVEHWTEELKQRVPVR